LAMGYLLAADCADQDVCVPFILVMCVFRLF
jgi:hypothetical protein